MIKIYGDVLLAEDTKKNMTELEIQKFNQEMLNKLFILPLIKYFESVNFNHLLEEETNKCQ